MLNIITKDEVNTMICYQDLREMMEMLVKRFLLLSHIEFNMIKVLVKTFIIKLEQMNVFSPRKYGKIRTRKNFVFHKVSATAKYEK